MTTRRPQVYGKRSRAVIDPFAVFGGSPEQIKPSAKQTITIEEVENTLAGLSLGKRSSEDGSENGRKPLGERDGNAVVKGKRSGKAKREKESPEKKSDDGDSHTQESVAPQTKALEVPRSPADSFVSPPVTLEPEIQRPESDRETVSDVSAKDNARQDDETERTASDKAREPVVIPDEDVPPSNKMIDPYALHTSSILELSSHPVESFSEWSANLSTHFDLIKIAEASFGEVYRLSLASSSTTSAHMPISRDEESVLKVIALTPPDATLPTQKREREKILKKAAMMSKPDDVASEVKLLQRMSCIPGFTNFRDVRIVKGRPPPAFIAAFRAFNASQRAAKKELSIFPDPARKASYNDDQLWAVIEMQDAGTDLEKLVEREDCGSVWCVWDVFWQTVLALAKGEEGAQFEHRDLHLGNICVRLPAGGSFYPEVVDVKRKLGFTGLEASLIDYTISRASMPSHTEESEEKTNEETATAFIDLSTTANDHLFTADSTEEYQYEIYRYMRSLLFFDDALAILPPALFNNPTIKGHSWQEFRPLTNLAWLHFILYKLLDQMYYPSAEKAPSRKGKSLQQKQAYATWKRGCELEEVLCMVQEMLDPHEMGKNGLLGASSLVGLAIHEGWLNVEDVVGEVDETYVGEVQHLDLQGPVEGVASLSLKPGYEAEEIAQPVLVEAGTTKSKSRSKKRV